MDLTPYLRLLRRRWLIIVVCVVAGAAGAITATRNTTKQYQASTRLFVNIPAARGVQEALQGVQLSSQLLQSYARIVTSQAVQSRVAERLQLASPAHVSASAEPETVLMTISAKDEDPHRAQLVANTTAAEFVATVRELEAGRTDPVQPRVIDEAGLSTIPVEPRPRVNFAIGLFLGTVVGLGLALVLEALDRSFESPEQAEELLGAPMLGIVPFRKELAKGPPTLALDPADQAGEAYRSLRTSVRFISPAHRLRTVLLTSPSPGDGKSTIAANLAIALAQGGERAIVVDADLRRGCLGELFELHGSAGLTSVIVRQVEMGSAVHLWRNLVNVLPTGPLPPNPAELVGSEAMAELVRHMADRADIVIFDAPPVLPVTDAVVLSTQVDGVILVIRSGRTGRSQAAEARRRLDVVGARVVGFVMNAVPAPAASHYYEDYRYASPGGGRVEGSAGRFARLRRS